MKQVSVLFLEGVVILAGIVTFILLLWEPHIEGVNAHRSFFEVYQDPFIILVYMGLIPFFIALYRVLKILESIRLNYFFSPDIVKSVRTIRHCAIAIILFVAVELVYVMLTRGLDDDPIGGFFMGTLIVLGALVVIALSIVFEWFLKKGTGPKSM